MFSTGYVVLLVDDEPDVLQVSKLAMKAFKVYGLPVKLYTASSKAEAIELYDRTLTTEQGQSAVAVAFIDVVMESDQAGLDLCRYIREEKGNLETQIYVRTGQPGSAPEREVIDRYNISGYFTKVEATEDKLYSLTKTGVRQFEVLSTGRAILEMINAMVVAGSREGIAGILNYVLSSLTSSATGDAHQLIDPRVCFLMDGEVIARHPSLDEATVLQAWRTFDDHDAVPLGENGDRYVVAGDHFMLRISGGQDQAELGYVAHLSGEVPETFPQQLYGLARPAAILWKRS